MRAQRRRWRAGLGWTLGRAVPSGAQNPICDDGDTTGPPQDTWGSGPGRESDRTRGPHPRGRGQVTAVPTGQSSSARWSPRRALLVAHSAFTDPRSRLSPAHPVFLEHIRAPSLVGGVLRELPVHTGYTADAPALGHSQSKVSAGGGCRSRQAGAAGWGGGRRWTEVGHWWAPGALPRLRALRGRCDCRFHGAGITALGLWRPHPQAQQELKPGWLGLLSASLPEPAWT